MLICDLMVWPHHETLVPTNNLFDFTKKKKRWEREFPPKKENCNMMGTSSKTPLLVHFLFRRGEWIAPSRGPFCWSMASWIYKATWLLCSLEQSGSIQLPPVLQTAVVRGAVVLAWLPITLGCCRIPGGIGESVRRQWGQCGASTPAKPICCFHQYVCTMLTSPPPCTSWYVAAMQMIGQLSDTIMPYQ